MSERMQPEALAEKLGDEDIVVIDVRDEERYVAAHVPGAVHLPLDAIEANVPDLPKDKLIITYCGGGTSGVIAAGILSEAGYRAVTMEGLRAWEAAGLPTQSGPDRTRK